MSKFELNSRQKELIIDALERRLADARKAENDMRKVKTIVGERLTESFKSTADLIEATLAAIDTAEANGQW